MRLLTTHGFNDNYIEINIINNILKSPYRTYDIFVSSLCADLVRTGALCIKMTILKNQKDAAS